MDPSGHKGASLPPVLALLQASLLMWPQEAVSQMCPIVRTVFLGIHFWVLLNLSQSIRMLIVR